MIYKSTLEIKNLFTNFFLKKKYTFINSSSLIPENDNSILFTNAGMNQFKEFFLGKKSSNLDKIFTIQRCLRAGGKHNDLEEVGYTNRHHTFFEMLGNFSFGKLTKEEIITDIWQLLTKKEHFNLSPDNILITINYNDIETFNIWNKIIGIKNDKILSFTKENHKYIDSNFWQMSDTGPCGPSTEIFYELKKNIFNSYKDNFINNNNNYLEIWNIVFMQYSKIKSQINGVKKYNLEPLANLCIDTGVGLERLASILQGVDSNYQIDLFKNLIHKICTTLKLKYDKNIISLNVLADHIRAIIFLVNEGVTPSNEGRGYVLRRIIRRAIRHGRYLGIKNKFLYKLIEPCLEQIKIYFTDLIFIKNIITKIIKEEEIKFSITLDRGMQILFNKINNLNNKKLSGEIACNLYDTYGLPFDLTKEICKEKNILINIDEYLNSLKKIKKNNIHNKKNICTLLENNNLINTNLLEYNTKKIVSKIEGIIVANKYTKLLNINSTNAIILLKNTICIPKNDNHIGDKGFLYNSNNNLFEIFETKQYNNIILHIGKLIKGQFNLYDKVILKINCDHREQIIIHHSTLHLLYIALKNILIDIKYKAHYINENYFSFDFNYLGKLENNFIDNIELCVNNKIQDNLPIKIDRKFNTCLKNINLNQQINICKPIIINQLCSNICNSTFVNTTSKIGYFHIFDCTNKSNSIFRIIGASGVAAVKRINFLRNKLYKIKNCIKSDLTKIDENIFKIYKSVIQLKKKNNLLNNKLIEFIKIKLSKKILFFNNHYYLIENIDCITANFMFNLIKEIKNKNFSCHFIFLLFNYLYDNKYYLFNLFIDTNKKNIINAIKNTYLFEIKNLSSEIMVGKIFCTDTNKKIINNIKKIYLNIIK